MKNLRKILAIVLAMTLMLTFSVGAMAEETKTGNQAIQPRGSGISVEAITVYGANDSDGSTTIMTSGKRQSYVNTMYPVYNLSSYMNGYDGYYVEVELFVVNAVDYVTVRQGSKTIAVRDVRGNYPTITFFVSDFYPQQTLQLTFDASNGSWDGMYLYK